MQCGPAWRLFSSNLVLGPSSSQFLSFLICKTTILKEVTSTIPHGAQWCDSVKGICIATRLSPRMEALTQRSPWWVDGDTGKNLGLKSFLCKSHDPGTTAMVEGDLRVGRFSQTWVYKCFCLNKLASAFCSTSGHFVQWSPCAQRLLLPQPQKSETTEKSQIPCYQGFNGLKG